MSSINKKIDFAVIFTVSNANPNGDPLNGNRPRTVFSGQGEVSDVCLKRKIRDRLTESNHSVFVKADAEFPSLQKRFEAAMKNVKENEIFDTVCQTWYDVRAFGQVFAFKSTKKTAKSKSTDEPSDADGNGADAVSIGVRGPVSIQSAISIDPIDIISTQITKSVSGEGDGKKKSSDTMGMKHRVDKGVYVFFGSINPQLAEKTGFSDADTVVLKEILPKLFQNDSSSARPDGTMSVSKVIWFEHNCKNGVTSSARVHRSVKVRPDGSYEIIPLDVAGLSIEEIDGF